MDSRQLALALLIDMHGINAGAWTILKAELTAMGDDDIIALVIDDIGRYRIRTDDKRIKKLPEYA